SMTNDLGEFRLYGMAPGRYYVSAMERGVASNTTDRTGYAPTYFPGTANLDEAQRVTIAGGQTITGINMTLLPVVAVRISGVALDSQGRPMAGANLDVSRRTGTGLFGSTYTPVRADGTFSI